MKNNDKALNFVVKKDGVKVATTAQAIKKFRKKLFRKTKQNLQLIKDSIDFIFVSELEKSSGTDFCGYIERSFDGNITKDGVNGVNDLIALVKVVATERGIIEPCIAYVNVNGQRLLITEGCGYSGVVFFNAEVKYCSDYDDDPYSDKGDTPFGWQHPSITEFYIKGLEKYDCDYELVTEVLLKGSCRCVESFDLETCEGCEFYNRMAHSFVKGKDVIYVKAV